MHLVHCVAAGPEHARQLASQGAHVAEALGRYAPVLQPAPQDLSRRSRFFTSAAGQAVHAWWSWAAAQRAQLGSHAAQSLLALGAWPVGHEETQSEGRVT